MSSTIVRDRIRLSSEVAGSIHDGGLVVLHVPSGRLFTSNCVGARIWQCLEQQLPLHTIAAEINREYGIDRTMALEHAERFVAQLEQNGLAE